MHTVEVGVGVDGGVHVAVGVLGGVDVLVGDNMAPSP